mgnify:CR=1 FL=1
MKLPDRVYDILKWVVMICIPALTTAYVGLAAVWGWPYPEAVAKTSAIACTLLGALLGISTAPYNKESYKDELFDNWEDNGAEGL